MVSIYFKNYNHFTKEMKSLTKPAKYILMVIILLSVFVLSLAWGRYYIPIKDVLKVLVSKIFLSSASSVPSEIDTVIFNIRLPRIITAVLIGGALSASGAAYQGMFKNPMVSPDILGASAGASFGAAIGILFSFSSAAIQVNSFLFGLAAVFLSWAIASGISKGSDNTLVLILSGILVGTLFTSFITLTKYVADPQGKLADITFYLMGSLASTNKKDLAIITLPILISMAVLLGVRWKLNVLSFGEEEAKTMGVDTKSLKFIVIISSTLMTASAVSVSGLIGWVGLVVPHFARMLVGPNYKNLLPASIILGGIYLLLVDNLARNLYSLEIPLGILTSLIGAPFFIYLMINLRRGWI